MNKYSSLYLNNVANKLAQMGPKNMGMNDNFYLLNNAKKSVSGPQLRVEQTLNGPMIMPPQSQESSANVDNFVQDKYTLSTNPEKKEIQTTPEMMKMLNNFKKSPVGVPPSRRGNYMGTSQPSLLGSAANWIGNQVSSAAGNIKGLASNPLVNPAAAMGAAGKAIGGGLGTMLGNAANNISINAPKPQMRTSAAPFGVRQIPNGQIVMPSKQQMIDEGQMDLANYGPGSVSGPDATTPLGNKMKQNLYKIDPNTGKALPPPPPLYPVGS